MCVCVCVCEVFFFFWFVFGIADVLVIFFKDVSVIPTCAIFSDRRRGKVRRGNGRQ